MGPKRAAIALLLCLAPIMDVSGQSVRGDMPGYAERLFARFPNTEVRYYPVYGDDAAAIRTSLDVYGLRSPTTQRPVDALSVTRITWNWPVDAYGKCDLSGLKLNFWSLIILPRLVTRRSPDSEVSRNWGKYMAALIDHEYGHVRHAFEKRDTVFRALRHNSCDRAHAAGLVALDAIRRDDLAYDVSTEHGQTQGARFP